MDNIAPENQQPAKRSVVADMNKRAADEAPAPAAKDDKKPSDAAQGAAQGSKDGQGGAGGETDLSKLTTEELIAKLKEKDAEALKERQRADKTDAQHRKVLKDWNQLNMKLKTSQERGEVSSKAAKELSGMAPGIDPENPFAFMQGDAASAHVAAIEKLMPDARIYLGAFAKAIQGMSEDEVEQVARDMLAEPDDASRFALAIKVGKDTVPEATLAKMRKLAQAGDPLKVLDEYEGNLSSVTKERDNALARVKELEEQLSMSVSSRAPLRDAGQPEPKNAGGKDGIDDKPLGVQLQMRRMARIKGR